MLNILHLYKLIFYVRFISNFFSFLVFTYHLKAAFRYHLEKHLPKHESSQLATKLLQHENNRGLVHIIMDKNDSKNEDFIGMHVTDESCIKATEFPFGLSLVRSHGSAVYWPKLHRVTGYTDGLIVVLYYAVQGAFELVETLIGHGSAIYKSLAV